MSGTQKMLARDEFFDVDVARAERACPANTDDHSSRGFARHLVSDAQEPHQSIQAMMLARVRRGHVGLIKWMSEATEFEGDMISKIRARQSTRNHESFNAITGSERRRRSVRASGVPSFCPRSARLDPVHVCTWLTALWRSKAVKKKLATALHDQVSSQNFSKVSVPKLR